jgi:hypothetical protein
VNGTSSLIEGVGNGSGVTFNSSNIKLQNCVINNFTNGLTDLGSNNTAYNDYLVNVNTGFNSTNISNSYYDNNTFVNTTTGYHIINDSNATIINNTFQNQSSFYYGGFMESGNGAVNPINVSNANNLSITQNNFNYTNGINVSNSANPQIFNNTFFATAYDVNAFNVSNLNYSFNNYGNTNNQPVTLNYDLQLDNAVNTTINNNTLSPMTNSFINSAYIILNSLNTVLENLNFSPVSQANFNDVNVSNSVNTLIINSVLQPNVAVSDFNSTNLTMLDNFILSSVSLNQSNSDVITNNSFNNSNSNLNAYNTLNETITSNNFSYNGGYGNNINLTNPENSVVSNNIFINSLNLQNATNNTLVYNNSVANLNSLDSNNITVQSNSIASALNSTGDSNANISGNTINTTNFFSTQNTAFYNNNLTASDQSLNAFNSNNLSIQSNQLYNATSITLSYLTSRMLFNTSVEEVFAVANGSAVTISSDGTTAPEVHGGSNLSVSYAYVENVSANITVLSQNKYYSNCSQVLTTVLNYLILPVNFTCWDYETVFTANGVGESYSYQPPVNLTLQSGLTSPPYLNSSVITNWNTLIANSSNVSITSDSDGLVYFNNTNNSILNSTNTTTIVFLNSLNDTVLNVTGIRNNIINYGGSDYVVKWFALLNITSNGQPKNTTFNLTNVLGNNYYSNASVVNGLTGWMVVNDFQKNNSGTLNFNPYTIVFGDPTTIVANITQTQIINANLNPNQTNLTASIQPSVVNAYGSNQVTSALYVNNSLNFPLNLTCVPTQSWLSANCSSVIYNSTNASFTLTVTPNFGSSGVYTAGVIVQGQNGSDYYSTVPNITVQYTAPAYNGGGGYIPPIVLNNSNTTTSPVITVGVSNATNTSNNTVVNNISVVMNQIYYVYVNQTLNASSLSNESVLATLESAATALNSSSNVTLQITTGNTTESVTMPTNSKYAVNGLEIHVGGVYTNLTTGLKYAEISFEKPTPIPVSVNESVNITPVTTPVQNNSNATETHANESWLDQIKSHYLEITLLIILIAVAAWFLAIRPKKPVKITNL